MELTIREKRVIRAFLDCVYWGKFSSSYVTVLVEDEARYGWMSEDAKTALYEALERQEEELDEAALADDGEDGPIDESDLEAELYDELGAE